MVKSHVMSATTSLMIPKKIKKNTKCSTITVDGLPHLGQERLMMAKEEQDDGKWA